MRRQQQGALEQVLLVFGEPKIDYPHECEFGFLSVLQIHVYWTQLACSKVSNQSSNRQPSYSNVGDL
jgi:hypothetical protein